MGNLSLSYKLFILFGFILTLSIIGSVVFITAAVSNRIRSQIELRGISLAKYLSSQAVEAYLQEDDLTLVSITAGLKRSNPGVISAIVVDDKNRIISHSDSILLKGKNFSFNNAKIYKVIVDSVTLNRAELYENSNGIVVKTPMLDRVRKKVVGYVYLTLSKKDVDDAIRNIIGLLFLAGTISIGFGLLVTMLFSRLLTRNIGILLEDLNIIGEGNLDHKPRIRSNDEIGHIARAVEDMSTKLKEVQQRLVETEKFKHEVELARRIQSVLLPRTTPKVKGFEFSTAYKPALLIGGDYYDFFRMMGGKLGFLVADVSGKGVAGSLVVVMFRSIIHTESSLSSSPKELILKAHENLLGEIPEDMYITSCIGSLKPENYTLTIASAGHNPPILYKHSSKKAIFLELEGAPLGLSIMSVEELDENLEEYTVSLEEGDVVVFYSDGITEATNLRNEQFGEDRFLRLVNDLCSSGYSAEEIKDGILANLQDFVKDTPQSDDITLVILKCVG